MSEVPWYFKFAIFQEVGVVDAPKIPFSAAVSRGNIFTPGRYFSRGLRANFSPRSD